MAIRVTCTSCGAAYKIDESKIPATGGAIRCQNCGTRFAVQRPPPEEAIGADGPTLPDPIALPAAPPPPVAPPAAPIALPSAPLALEFPEADDFGDGDATQVSFRPSEPLTPPASEPIALPASAPTPAPTIHTETTKPGFRVPPATAIPLPPPVATLPPAVPPIALPAKEPSFSDTLRDFSLPPEPMPAEITQPSAPPVGARPLSIPLPSVNDVMSDDTPIALTDDDDIFSMDDATTVAPPPTGSSVPLDLPEHVENDVPDRGDAFDDLPAPSLASSLEPEDLPGFDTAETNVGPRPTAPLEDEPLQFSGISLSNAPAHEPPSDLPRPLPAAAEQRDDLPTQLGTGVSEDDVPEPLEASIPDAGPDLSSIDQMPEPLDIPEPVSAVDLASPLHDIPSVGADGEVIAPPPKRNIGRRVALLASVLVLMTVGALAASYFMTGQMPWGSAEQPKPVTEAASAPVLAPLPPLPETAEGKDLEAHRKALAVLEERKAGRKARNQPEDSAEDEAVRAKLLWQGAMLLGSRSLAAALEQDRAISTPEKEGETPHPNIERAQAALAFLQARPADMNAILDRLLARDKGDNDALLIRGYAKLQANETIDASKAFDDVLKINPKNIDALLGHAEVARRAQDRDGAASYVEQAEAASPDNARVRLLRAELQLDESESRAQGKKTLAALAKNDEALGERDRARLHMAVAKLAAQSGLAKVARDELEEARTIDASPAIYRAIIWQKIQADALEDAAKALDAASKADMDAGESIFLAKAQLLYKQGSGEKLIELAKQGTVTGMEKRATIYATALGLEAQKKVPAALKVYAADAKIDKTFSWPALADVRLRNQKGKVKLMRLGLIAKISGDAMSQAAYGEALFDEGQFKPAAERYEAALEKDPWVLPLDRIAEHYGVALTKSGRTADAARIAIANQSVDPKDPKAVLAAVGIAKDAEAYDEAQHLIEQGLEEHPKDTALRIAQAEIFVLRDNREKARTLLQQLLKDDDKNANVHEAMARTYYPQDPDLVKLHIKTAIQLNPNEARYHMLLGDSYFSKNKYDEAKDAYDRAHELQPTNVDTIVQLSRVADLQGRKKESIDRAREALKLDPSRKQLLVELGERLEDMGQRSEALQLYQEAFKHDPKQTDLLVRIGHVYQLNGNRAAALKAFLVALKAKPSDPQIHYRLGYLYKDSNQPKPAIKAFEAYLKLNPKADDRRDIETEIDDLKR